MAMLPYFVAENGSAMTTGQDVSTTDTPLQAALHAFEGGYSIVHGYLAVGVCSFGVAMNVCNAYVLTRRNLANSATNILLVALSLADLVTNAIYIPFALYFYIITRPDSDAVRTSAEQRYGSMAINLTLLFHTMSMWLTVAVTAFRYVFVCHYSRARSLCSCARARIAIAVTAAAAIATSVPSFVCFTTHVDPETSGGGGLAAVAAVTEDGVGYWNATAAAAMPWTDECTSLLKTVSFLLFGGVVKASACLVLVILSWLLVVSLHGANKRHHRLTRSSGHNKSCSTRSEPRREERGKRTTVMLVAVATTFVAIELPQGVLVLVSAASEWYFKTVYVNLGDLFDILVLVKSAANFILYASMSKLFRNTFRKHVLACFSVRRENRITYTPVNVRTKDQEGILLQSQGALILSPPKTSLFMLKLLRRVS